MIVPPYSPRPMTGSDRPASPRRLFLATTLAVATVAGPFAACAPSPESDTPGATSTDTTSSQGESPPTQQAPRPPRFALGDQATCVLGDVPSCVGTSVFQVPDEVSALAGARDLALGLRHGCLLDADGRAACWGDGLEGQLGVAPAALSERRFGRPIGASPRTVPDLPALAQIVSGWVHTCGRTADGDVLCWGDDARGQLGRGQGAGAEPDRSGSDVAGVTAVAGLTNIADLAAGGLHSCALDGDGAVHCWGDGSFGQLGTGTPDDASTPVAVAGLGAKARRITTGAYHSCAVLDGGGVSCWGDARFGQVGDGTRERRPAPVSVEGLRGPADDVAAGATFTCALLSDGSVQCWGSNEFGELGLGRGDTSGNEPDSVPRASGTVALPSPALGIAAAGVHACAVLADESVHCWGGNESGQLGDGSRELRRTPVLWSGASPDPLPAPPDWRAPAEGIDVSYHSGHVDWAAAKADGSTFALTLATAGVDFRDPFLTAHWTRMREAGLVRGAYHFYVADDDPVEQAHHFLSHVVLEPGDLRPVVDIESAGKDSGAADLVADLERFVEEVEQTIGIAPIVYTGPVFWRDRVGSDAFRELPLWIAEYGTDTPIVPPGWSTWSLWQYRGNAEMPHVAPIVDLNRLHADVDTRTLRVPESGVVHAVGP